MYTISFTGLVQILAGHVKIFAGHINFQNQTTSPMGKYTKSLMLSPASLTIVYSIVYSGEDQRKHQSSTSLAFVRWIHQGLMNSLHKWPVTQKMFPLDDVTMDSVDWLWLSDDIWQHRSGTTQAQVMACCLTPPSHYLNLCSLQWGLVAFTWGLQEMFKIHVSIIGVILQISNVFQPHLPKANEITIAYSVGNIAEENSPAWWDWPCHVTSEMTKKLVCCHFTHSSNNAPMIFTMPPLTMASHHVLVKQSPKP